MNAVTAPLIVCRPHTPDTTAENIAYGLGYPVGRILAPADADYESVCVQCGQPVWVNPGAITAVTSRYGHIEGLGQPRPICLGCGVGAIVRHMSVGGRVENYSNG